MLHDQDLSPQQTRVYWPCSTSCIINIHRVDADEFDATIYEIRSGVFRQVRVVIEVAITIPESVPASVDQHSSRAQFFAAEHIGVKREFSGVVVGANDYAIKVRKLLHTDFREIFPIGVPMKRTIQIRAGVGDHFDFGDLEFSSWTVLFSGVLPAQVIADDRSWQSFVGNKPMFDGMTQ